MERFWNWTAEVVSPALTEVWQPPGKRKACQPGSAISLPSSWLLVTMALERLPTAGNIAGCKVERDVETLTASATHQWQRTQCSRKATAWAMERWRQEAPGQATVGSHSSSCDQLPSDNQGYDIAVSCGSCGGASQHPCIKHRRGNWTSHASSDGVRKQPPCSCWYRQLHQS